MKVLITVKTYPIPSAKYDELVCTAGVREDGGFVRLYPINFRDLPFSQQYKKYQWIEVQAAKHRGQDARKESYRPNCDTIKLLGEPIPAARNWAERAKFVLRGKSDSIEHLNTTSPHVAAMRRKILWRKWLRSTAPDVVPPSEERTAEEPSQALPAGVSFAHGGPKPLPCADPSGAVVLRNSRAGSNANAGGAHGASIAPV